MSIGLALEGQRIGRWTVLARRQRGRRTYWECRCDCGQNKSVDQGSLRSGRTRSCGCLSREALSARAKHGHLAGRRPSRTYLAWREAKNRCLNHRHKSYSNYGGRGIRMCPEWLGSFEAFLIDMGECPAGMTIDRRDTNGSYSKDNCRWATPLEQNRNKRSNHKLTINGETLCMSEWIQRSGLCRGTLERRVQLGWPASELFSPVASKHSNRKVATWTPSR